MFDLWLDTMLKDIEAEKANSDTNVNDKGGENATELLNTLISKINGMSEKEQEQEQEQESEE